jgi:hypothetical protein
VFQPTEAGSRTEWQRSRLHRRSQPTLRDGAFGASASLLDARRRSADRFESSRSPPPAGPAPLSRRALLLQAVSSGICRTDPPAIAWRGECRQRSLGPNLDLPGAGRAAEPSMLSVYMAVGVRPFPKLPPLLRSIPLIRPPRPASRPIRRAAPNQATRHRFRDTVRAAFGLPHPFRA